MMDRRLWSLMFKGRLDPRGWFFVSIGATITLLLLMVSGYKWAFLGALVTGCLGLFFRDPERIPPVKQGVIVSPADGLVLDIIQCAPPEDLGLSDHVWTRVSIFLNIWDVHVNRAPVAGTVVHKVYLKGKFLHAADAAASLENEKCGIVIQTPEGHRVGCVQIAGYVARRIVCELNIASQTSVGQKYGIICFGSRVDLYLPQDVELFIQEGQRMIAGETMIGLLSPLE